MSDETPEFDLPEWALREARIALTSAEDSWIAAAPAVVRRGPIENSAFRIIQSHVARALVAARRAGREEMREECARAYPVDAHRS